MECSFDKFISRREAIQKMAGGVGALALSVRSAGEAGENRRSGIEIDPARQYELSPYLFMQFMEPLGATDGSVEAAWDHQQNGWREDVVEVTRELAPPLLRWGGCFSSFYRWREAVGPREQRKPMYNLLWGGMESNQIGTAEFVEFCELAGAEPLMCVNFESDGRGRWMKDPAGRSRKGDAEEAAEWVRYCNNPENALRISHGYKKPLPIKIWQVGNETSYDKKGFDCETTIAKTIEFARAMRKADPKIELIGWGDNGWAPRMIEAAGEHLQYIAFHNMFNPDRAKKPVLQGELYRRDPEATWGQLMKAWEISDRRIRGVRDSLGNKKFRLALTECHFSIPGRDRCDVMSTWATGVAYARMLNNFQRHGDLLKIATAADFCGNRWQVNAVMIPTPRSKGKAYLMPVARVMKLYRHHFGRHAVKVKSQEVNLDVVASRSDKRIYLHVVNTNRTKSVRTSIQMAGKKVREGRAFVITEDPTIELSYLNSDKVMQISEKNLVRDGAWEFPAASVCAVEFSV